MATNTTSKHFPLNAKGYLKAKKWLKEIGKWEYISTHGFSTDGYSIIEEANSIYDKLQNHHEIR